MIIEKQYIGKNKMPFGEVAYFMIQKAGKYGVEVAEEANEKIISSSEFFSEDPQEALAFIQKIYELGVTSVTLQDVIDDYLSK